jgi:MerR family transcriptional regulator/heat shock protein HspR
MTTMAHRNDDAVYIISVAAEIAGVHPQTLRIYERKGLISPFRTPGGTRRYSNEDLTRLALIQDLTSQGLNLEGVRRVMRLRDENERLRRQVERLRRLLADSEQRVSGQPKPGETVIRRTTVVRRRHLPDIRRVQPFD